MWLFIGYKNVILCDLSRLRGNQLWDFIFKKLFLRTLVNTVKV